MQLLSAGLSSLEFPIGAGDIASETGVALLPGPQNQTPALRALLGRLFRDVRNSLVRNSMANTDSAIYLSAKLAVSSGDGGHVWHVSHSHIRVRDRLLIVGCRAGGPSGNQTAHPRANVE